MSGLEVGGAVEGLKGLKEVAEFISAELQAARERLAEDVELLQTYAHLALAAIGALEREYDEILNETLVLNLKDKKALDTLWKRIDSYLTQDRVRLELTRVVAGLDALSGDFVEQAEAYFARRKMDRHLAASKLRETVSDLKGYLQSLVIMAPGRGRNISAVGIHDLLRLDAFLDDVRQRHDPGASYKDEDRALVELVREFRRNRSKDGMLRFYEDLERSYVTIRRAFR
jgi:hypothetical protein